MGIIEQEIVAVELNNGKEFTVEKNERDDIHLHIDNIRIEFSPTEFEQFAEAIISGRKSIEEYKNDL